MSMNLYMCLLALGLALLAALPVEVTGKATVFVSIGVSDTSCTGQEDGQYSVSDVFTYAECKAGKRTMKQCDKGQVFFPTSKHSGTCRKATEADKESFCNFRPNGDYRNPWNCHHFFKCFAYFTYDYKCQLDGLVFDPVKDQCVYPGKYACENVTIAGLSGMSCKGKKDGQYSVIDTFKYAECKGGEMTVKSCYTGLVYFQTSDNAGKCRKPTEADKESFCKNRPNHDFRNPWNCHGFFKCNYGTTHAFKCQFANLVFDPDLDECVYPEKYECKNVTASKALSLDVTDSCKDKKDGNYEVRDTFGYLECKGGKGTQKMCEEGDIFVTSPSKECVKADVKYMDSFCDGRSTEGTGDYRNPWDCHHYLTCAPGKPKVYDRKCDNGTKEYLVYDPQMDMCNFPYFVECKQLPKSLTTVGKCAGKSDGNYTMQDVFKYRECKGGKETIKSCEITKNEICVAQQGGKCSCQAVTEKKDKDTFCKYRAPMGKATGDYRDPWDCHSFFKCALGHPKPFVFPCAAKQVYDPDQDRCHDIPCKQLPSASKALVSDEMDPCKDKKDGNYEVRDTFGYLECKGGKGTQKMCEEGDIFVTSPSKECVKADVKYMDSFCDSRSTEGTGDYRNPWDCHHYLTCAPGKPKVYDRKCDNGTKEYLVYDPKMDMCNFPYFVECKQLPKSLTAVHACTGKADGNYTMQDVFKYRECKGGKETIKSCDITKSEICVSQQGGKCSCKAVTEKKDKDTFCKYRAPMGNATGDYRDPWDCHSFFKCALGHPKPFVFPCAAKQVYDPDQDRCHDIPCKQLPSESLTAVHACTGKADGNYTMQDVFKYRECKGGKEKIKSCDITKSEICVSQQGGKCSCKAVTEKKDKDTFCKYRAPMGNATGDYRDPWDCHSFFKCALGHPKPFVFPCAAKQVYDPDQDRCHDIPCKQLPSASLKEINPCKDKKDGNYEIRDTFGYLECKGGKGTEKMCEEGDIFVTSPSKECVKADIKYMETFCDGRSTKGSGNYRDPWDCHHYLTCSIGKPKVYDRKCDNGTKEYLVYDPKTDMCNFPFLIACKQLRKSLNNDNADLCAGKADGNYTIRDVFKYRECKGGKGTLKSCDMAKKEICIAEAGGKCSCKAVTEKKDFDTFCANRAPTGNATGDYRNPWDCYSFLKCALGHPKPFTFDCAAKQVYDPYQDRCHKFKCDMIPPSGRAVTGNTTRDYRNPWNCYSFLKCAPGLLAPFTFDCAAKQVYDPDQDRCRDTKCDQIPPSEEIKDCTGKTSRDVFSYWDCTNGQELLRFCPPGQIYVNAEGRCKEGNLNDKKLFCHGKKDGNYRNPWDCHNFITCVAEQGYDRVCPWGLYYNPEKDECQSISETPCQEVNLHMHNDVDTAHNIVLK